MRKLRAAVLVLALILLSACGEDAAGTNETATPSLSQPEMTVSLPSEEPSEEIVEDVPVNPLTGLPMDGAQINARPVAVMLNNLKAALPQQGNSAADIIYEIVTEGGITRMLGVYQSVEDVGILGSVRSAREYYIDIALGHDAIYIHAGGSTQAYEDLEALDVDHMDGVRGQYSYAGSGLFWRDQERVDGKHFDYEHSLVASGESIRNALNESGLRLQHEESYVYEMRFAEDGTPDGGETANCINVPFSSYKTGVFRYDAEQGVYLVEEYGEAYIDGNTGEQISVTNVLVLRTNIVNTGDSYGHVEVEFSGGDGWFACGGKIIPITWEKSDRYDQFHYYTMDGQPLTLGQGKSYVNIISTSKEIDYQ